VTELDESLQAGNLLCAGALGEDGYDEWDVETDAPALAVQFTDAFGSSVLSLVPLDEEGDEIIVTPASFLATRLAQDLILHGASPLVAVHTGYIEVKTLMGLDSLPLPLYQIDSSWSQAWDREMGLNSLASSIGSEPVALVQGLADDFLADSSFDGWKAPGTAVTLAGGQTLPSHLWSQLANFGSDLPPPSTTLSAALFAFSVKPLPFAVSGEPVQISWYAAASPASGYEVDIFPGGHTCLETDGFTYSVSGNTLSLQVPPFTADTTLVCVKAFLNGNEEWAQYPLFVDLRQ